MSSSAAKKPKTTNTSGDEFEIVKKYLMECPHVSANHPAVKGALEGLEKERQRLERDTKLQRKFAASNAAALSSSGIVDGVEATSAGMNGSGNVMAASSLSAAGSSMTSSMMGDDLVVIDQPAAALSVPSVDTDEMMEWQDVTGTTSSNNSDQQDEEGGTSFIGEKLAKVAIDAISEHHVKAKSPVSAIAVALHAALRSDLLGFACTGVPEDKAKKGGFAAPIRELPKSQFLPPNWDNTTVAAASATKSSLSTSSSSSGLNKVSLRYRKKETGARILIVREMATEDETTTTATMASPMNSGTIEVQFSPTSSTQEGPDLQSLSFPLDEHVNLDSWNAALNKASSVPIPPALHYKGLIMLLTKFCRSFDLGSVDENTSSSLQATAGILPALPYVDNTIAQPAGGSASAPFIRKSDFVPPQQPIPNSDPSTAPRGDGLRRPWDDDGGLGVPTTVDQAFPGATGRGRLLPSGDFAGDLAPAGLIDPQFGRGGNGRMGGNLLGPNHPMFSGGGLHGPAAGGLPMGGPGTMQPRFDPVYPPGVHDPDGIGVGGNPAAAAAAAANRRRLNGEPNPDHLRPPSSGSFGHDMFS